MMIGLIYIKKKILFIEKAIYKKVSLLYVYALITEIHVCMECIPSEFFVPSTCPHDDKSERRSIAYLRLCAL